MNHVGWLHGTHASRAQARPDLSGKRIQGRQTHLERQNRIRAKTGRGDAAVGRRHRDRNRRSRLEVRRHDGPRLAAGLDVPLGGQQGISGFDGASCQTQFLGQRAGRGNAVTRLQQSAGNSAAKPIVDLAIEGFGRRWIQAARSCWALRRSWTSPTLQMNRHYAITRSSRLLWAQRYKPAAANHGPVAISIHGPWVQAMRVAYRDDRTFRTAAIGKWIDDENPAC